VSEIEGKSARIESIGSGDAMAAIAAKVAAMSEAEREARGIELRDRDTPLSREELLEFLQIYFGGGLDAPDAFG
jgi:hypothetical protein